MATVRRIFKQGNSCVITLPTNVLAHVGCLLGDNIELTLITGSQVVLRKFDRTARASSRRAYIRRGPKKTKPGC